MQKLPLLEARSSFEQRTHSDTVLVGVFQDSKKRALLPKAPYDLGVKKLDKTRTFEGKYNALQFARFLELQNCESTLFVGLGIPNELTPEKVRSVGGKIWSKLFSEKCKTIVVDAETFLNRGLPSEDHHKWLRALAEGLILGAYQFNKYKSRSDDSAESSYRFSFVCRDSRQLAQVQKELAEVQVMAEALRVTRDWSNEPSNVGTPTYFANEAKRLSRTHGLKCKVLDKKDLIREKMNLYLGVSRGSDQEPRLVIVEYVPKKLKNAKKIAIVGKGVTFDSGGISIKPAARMEEMKHDMTGAASVMGAVLLAAKWKAPNHVIGIMAFTENMPDGKAIQPGNIFKSRNGKTVEVINTDAEGRLVLADALDYAQDLKPDAVIDIATLTGAVSIALGKQCCAIFGNDEGLVQSIRNIGDLNGERMWQLPLYDEYFDDLRSDYADMKNVGNDPYGGAIRAALFLKQFIRKNTRWAHLDIAAMDTNLGHISYYPKRGANGIYVRTLAGFAMEY